MSGNLEDFLRQAAQRRQQRAGGQQIRGGNRPQGNPNYRQNIPDIAEAEIIDAEIIEPELGEGVSSRRRSSGNKKPSSSVSKSLPPPRLSSINDVDQADERMAKHVKDWMDHPVSHLSNDQVSYSSENPTAAIAPATPNLVEIDKATNVQHRQQHKSPLVDLLRNPESLKSAFIISEIFTRKF